MMTFLGYAGLTLALVGGAAAGPRGNPPVGTSDVEGISATGRGRPAFHVARLHRGEHASTGPRRDAAAPGVTAERSWRGGWCSWHDIGTKIAVAKKLHFHALITHAPLAEMRKFARLAKENGIESYYWFSINWTGRKGEPPRQIMSPGEERRMRELKADNAPGKHGYQFGGEPLPGREDVLLERLFCFHHPETVTYCRDKIRRVLEACPDLTGVAFDYFGYQNYRCCHCPLSEELFAKFRGVHPNLTEQEARDRFSLTTLTAFTNGLADYVRRIKPGAKVAIHVYPTFLPQPLYGNRLDVDYCCQTAAWFFEPYWSDDKIARYARVIVQNAKRHFPRRQGIPFVGVFVGRAIGDKPVARLARELRLIFDAAGTTSLSVYNFDEFIKHPEYGEAVRDLIEKYEKRFRRTVTP